ncbi:MAG: alanine--glyoxylate aminotransferase family protein [Gemmatimonadaceae bacterium]|nr:alanine--glyoxylate aminotransferase family protein [Gemmatimonadaceae bacterium]
MTFGTFFLPGPTEVHPDVLKAMSQPMMSHRGPEFEEIFVRVQEGMKKVFVTERPVFISTSSGTGMMEAAIRCAPEGKILALVDGAFSERFANIAESCGRDVEQYEVAWGEVHDVMELERRLAAGKYSAITVAHSETSSGALNDVRALSDAAHKHGVLCLIDSVSGLAGAELRFDEWGLDYVLTGSQKALALPPGLAFSVASEKFMQLAKTTRNRGTYYDLVEYEEFTRNRQAPNTPAISLYYALDFQLGRILSEGIEARWARHLAMQKEVIGWAERMGLRLIAVRAGRSPTVSCIELPKGADMNAFLARVADQGITLGTGYGKLKASTFRIGHMGDHTVETIQRCLAACEKALKDS